ncbi:hypothetical protein GCM10011490_04760 [Pseudoclavibacter endophyticus]|uniref:Uncharacterized protein n=1 Tax=Pseudoclavibacter endophyticus TaxID=1778590 RepID=A0A6H9WMA1_9MICO|nr:hypothetical protein [Pseudoclavibacter endophyticus]KAB1650016.1 hypothetical protein F8O04_07315 [Pseudoclavibacter endophyticus]GGA57952.1 hypothetical protein GCM10011490_04760 [Pseudoclavibacter endophyticus]
MAEAGIEGGRDAAGAVRRLVAAIVARGGHATSLTRRGDGSISAAALAASRGPLRPGEAVTLLAPVAETLAIAHALGVAHGAVSLEAIVVDPSGKPMLGGWQHVVRLARPSRRAPRRLLRRRAPLDARSSDTHALAAALREVLGTGAAHDHSFATGTEVERVTAAAIPSTGEAPTARRATESSSPAQAFAEALYAWSVPEPLDLIGGAGGSGSAGHRYEPSASAGLASAGERWSQRGVLGALRRRPLLGAVAAVCAAALAAVVLVDGAHDASPEAPGAHPGARSASDEARGDGAVADEAAAGGGGGHSATPIEGTTEIDDPLAAATALLDARNSCALSRDETCLMALYAGDAPGLEVDLAIIDHPAPPISAHTRGCAVADRNGNVALIVCAEPSGAPQTSPTEAGMPPESGTTATIVWAGTCWLLRELETR